MNLQPDLLTLTQHAVL